MSDCYAPAWWYDEDQEPWQRQEEREYAEAVVGYECPYCSTVYSTVRSDCDGTDIVCCGEVGECTPYTREHQHRDERGSNASN